MTLHGAGLHGAGPNGLIELETLLLFRLIDSQKEIMKTLFRLLVIVGLTLPSLGCPGEVGEQNQNTEGEDLTEHDEFGNVVTKPAPSTTPETE
jgi:hypothetical protein